MKEELRIEQVIKNVIQYWNSQQMDILYTWQGVSSALLHDSLQQQVGKYQKAKTALNDAEKEIEQVYEIFDDDLRNMQQRLEELIGTNEMLIRENSLLRAKLTGTENTLVIYRGEEEEFYPDEIKEIVREALDNALKNTDENTRRADILSDILESNEYKHLPDERKKCVKALFKGYKNLSSAMKQELSELGITVSEEGICPQLLQEGMHGKKGLKRKRDKESLLFIPYYGKIKKRGDASSYDSNKKQGN